MLDEKDKEKDKEVEADLLTVPDHTPASIAHVINGMGAGGQRSARLARGDWGRTTVHGGRFQTISRRASPSQHIRDRLFAHTARPAGPRPCIILEETTMSRKKAGVTRRAFLGTVGATAGLLVIQRHVLGATSVEGLAPSDRISLAIIGCGGRGAENIGDLRNQKMTQNIVALCDVDQARSGKTFAEFPQAKAYKDFRKMLDEMDKSIDAVLVAIPDHAHAVAAMAAIKHGKHIYCEKPLAHSVMEVRALQKAAKEHKVVSQLGNQGHSFDSCAMFVEWIRDGAIGQVSEVHATCQSSYSGIDKYEQLKEKYDVPASLDWDLWLGPAKPRPYNPMFVPGKWRSWFPFGTGCIGDWVCHTVDPVFWALDLDYPTSVEAQVKGFDPKVYPDTFAKSMLVKFEFPAKGTRRALTLNWHEGNWEIPRPAEMEASRTITGCGAVVMGEKSGIMYGSHGAGGLRIYPEEKMKAYKQPAQTIARGREHHQDWFKAIRSGGKAGSDFEYGGKLTELALLSGIASRFPGRKLEWDGPAGTFTNCPEAAPFVNPELRKGWTL
jgi:predicted dehydrogenase